MSFSGTARTIPVYLVFRQQNVQVEVLRTIRESFVLYCSHKYVQINLEFCNCIRSDNQTIDQQLYGETCT